MPCWHSPVVATMDPSTSMRAVSLVKRAGSQKIKSYEVAEMALYHELGRLPEPQFTHRFC